MSTLDSVRNHLIALLQVSSDVVIDADTSLRDDLGVESIDAITLLADLEMEFCVRIEDHQLLNLRTVGDVARLIDDLSVRDAALDAAPPAGH